MYNVFINAATVYWLLDLIPYIADILYISVYISIFMEKYVNTIKIPENWFLLAQGVLFIQTRV